MSNAPRSSTSVLVLGAGLTGLSAAGALAPTGVEVRHVEKERFVGGHAVSVEDEGFRFDRTGHLLHLRDDATRARVRALLGDELLEVERRSVVRSHGVYTEYPFQANTFGLPPAVVYECVMGFLRAHYAPPASPPRDFEAFCRGHFGDAISERFLLPYNERLWGVAPREITAAWCDRYVPLPALEDVVAGAVGAPRRALGYNARFLFPRRGIGALPAAMARALPPVELGRAPVAIDWRRKCAHFADEVVDYRALINTAPLDTLGRLLVEPPPDVAEAFAALRCSSLHYLDVAVDALAPRAEHWVYVPEARYPFYRVGCYSNFSPGMAPPGCSSFYVELVDRRPPDLASLAPAVVADLVDLGLVARASDVRFVRARALSHAYVIYDHDYEAALGRIRPFLAEHALFSTGRYGGWNYSSMEDALRFGDAAAADALARI